MKTMIIASKNAGKIEEFKALFQPAGFEVLSLLDLKDAPDVEETGQTFKENARLKAEAIAKKYGCYALADDSGLVIDALDGRPGVYSARYAGESKDDQMNIEKVLSELDGVPMERRTAHFCCVLAVATPNGPTFYAEGKCEGLIAETPKGNNGFGYDPIFFLPDKNRTFAELTSVEKSTVSHRAKALQQLEKLLPGWAGDGR